MSEIERQARGWWARLLAWLRGAQGGEAARKARETLQDVRTSDAGRRAESALRDLKDSDAGRKAKEAVKDLRDSEAVGKARDAAKDVLKDLREGDAGRKAKEALRDLRDGATATLRFRESGRRRKRCMSCRGRRSDSTATRPARIVNANVGTG